MIEIKLSASYVHKGRKIEANTWVEADTDTIRGAESHGITVERKERPQRKARTKNRALDSDGSNGIERSGPPIVTK